MSLYVIFTNILDSFQHSSSSNRVIFILFTSARFVWFETVRVYLVYKNQFLNTQQFYCWDEKNYPDEVRMRFCYNTGHEPMEKKQT